MLEKEHKVQLTVESTKIKDVARFINRLVAGMGLLGDYVVDVVEVKEVAEKTGGLNRALVVVEW